MSLTIQQALTLSPGTLLTFGTAYTYTVVAVEPSDHGRKVRLSLLRDDGFETFATQHDLSKMSYVAKNAPEVPPETHEQSVDVSALEQQLADMASDPEVQTEIEPMTDFPAYPIYEGWKETRQLTPIIPEPSLDDSISADDPAVDDKPAPKGKKGKGKKS